MELLANAMIQTHPSAAKGTRLCGPARRVHPVAVLVAAMIQPQKLAAQIRPRAPWVMTACLAAVVLAARSLAEVANAMIRTRKNAASRAILCGLARQLRHVAMLVIAMNRTVNSAVLGVPAPRRIFVASMSVVFQLHIVGPMDIAQEHLHLPRQTKHLHLPRQAEHRHPPPLRQKHRPPSVHRVSLRQQVRRHHACHQHCRQVLQQVIRAITYWLMATACLSWTLSMSMVSRKS